VFRPQLGVSLHTISANLTDELIRAVASSHIATLELSAEMLGDETHQHKRDVLLQGLADRVRLMTIHARFGNGYDFSVLDWSAGREALAALDSSISLAVQLQVPMIVVHASAEPVIPAERAQRFARAQAALGEIGQRCQKEGKRLAVELLPRTCLGNTVEELLELLAPLDRDTFGVCLDTNHLMDRPQDLAWSVRHLGSRLITLHLSDYDGIDEKHLCPGKGVLDWGSFLQALRDINYEGPFNYECRIEGETISARIRALEDNFAWLSRL
jgi:sugar phosphate isomerase/epimerase